jgi:hypothetical protein
MAEKVNSIPVLVQLEASLKIRDSKGNTPLNYLNQKILTLLAWAQILTCNRYIFGICTGHRRVRKSKEKKKVVWLVKRDKREGGREGPGRLAGQQARQ